MSVDPITVKVTRIHQVAPAIREFTLTPVATELSAFSPGSHVVVAMQGPDRCFKNAYSLLSDPRDTGAYRIAVLLQKQSRGGSRFMHEQVREGDELTITPPSNLFAPLWEARKHVLIAGGVGITPFLSYLPELQRQHADFELHHLFKGDYNGAYCAELAEQLGERYFDYDSSAGRKCDLAQLFNGRPLGTHFYVCGPLPLIEAVQAGARLAGVPDSLIHYEEFSTPQPGEPFEVELKASGRVVPVGSEESMLEALEAAGVPVPNLCRGGVCGQCVCAVADGEPEHRDHFLSASERHSGKLVMPCVSRAKGPRLVIDIEE